MIGQRAWFDILPAAPRRPVVVAWALMAVLNLSAGLVIASLPERRSDLDNMRRWERQWLLEDLDVYAPAEARTATYPPYAIVMLSPLAVLPDSWAAPVWAMLNVALGLVVPWLALRAVRPSIPFAAAITPMLMFLCWGGFRALLQFSLLALTFGLLAMVLARRRPVWSGVCLGLALVKPQIGIPFLLWTVFTRRWRLVVTAAVCPAAGTIVYCVKAGTSPLMVAVHYQEILRMNYTGNALVVGLSQISPLVALAASDPHTVDTVTATIAVLLLVAICLLGFDEGTRRDNLMFSAPALAGIWSLLVFYHLTYGFLLLLPTATLLLFLNDPPTVRVRRNLLWALQLGVMIDVPGIWRRVGPAIGAPELLNLAVMHTDRVLMLTLFASIALMASRIRIQ